MVTNFFWSHGSPGLISLKSFCPMTQAVSSHMSADHSQLKMQKNSLKLSRIFSLSFLSSPLPLSFPLSPLLPPLFCLPLHFGISAWPSLPSQNALSLHDNLEIPGRQLCGKASMIHLLWFLSVMEICSSLTDIQNLEDRYFMQFVFLFVFCFLQMT